MAKQLPKFEGFVETVPAKETRMDYNVVSENLAAAVLTRTNDTFREQFPGFPGLEGILQVLKTGERRELIGSNFPVLAGLNDVNLQDLGIQLCDERDLARVYNEEVRRLAEGKEGFFRGKFWFDVSLIRNPYATQEKLMPWEAELDEQINALRGKVIVSVPYRAIVPVRIESDNTPFGKVSGYSFRIKPALKDAIKTIAITEEDAQNGYDFSGLDSDTAFPVKGQGKHFYGISGNRRFSRLDVNWYLDADRNENPLNSNEGGRVVFKSAEGTCAEK